MLIFLPLVFQRPKESTYLSSSLFLRLFFTSLPSVFLYLLPPCRFHLPLSSFSLPSLLFLIFPDPLPLPPSPTPPSLGKYPTSYIYIQYIYVYILLLICYFPRRLAVVLDTNRWPGLAARYRALG